MRRRRTRTLSAAVGALALALVVALAACGGSDDDAATTGVAETGAAAANVRLDAASWEQYEETRTQARAVNEEAITTFRSCRELVNTQVPADRVQACFGDSVASVVTEGQHVMNVLDELNAEADGACADAGAQLRGNVKIYTATVSGLGRSIEHGTLPSTQEIESALAMLTRSRAAAAGFERACKPA
jgi:hypothetical protein